MHEVNIRILPQSLHQRIHSTLLTPHSTLLTPHSTLLTPHFNPIPSHARHFVLMALRLETLHLSIEDADTVYVTFLRMLAEQLLPDADTEDGLLEIADHLVKPACSQILHRLTGVPLTREQHLVCFRQQLGIISQSGLDSHPAERVHHRVDVACVIFYDCYVHHEKIIVLFLYVRILR